VSRHLRVLLDAGLLAVVRSGPHRIHRLDVPADALDALDALSTQVRACQAAPHP
jgi:ArsR family transcriptional regulator